ncbi:uncharacterized protein LACBIDRAFT_322500 [Laccaria bicolor S238N-H82]|uniref:Predicted protein n=1 Tax=Laccaria bicolor (strain S238N-H82 / ATCC MYA-4686) TaxID=486041 RepID=B0CWI3_LACBS|nr:uncharacterized protein LACBIDRAFT_322500 [Laccaria bicolor S238N-H82]EDR13515.1 predicted protein [Laccaria bicolor S238N-H82]|eukprot:XP_001876013.1 predicted protein [Laccaria bicolor S238N-H82]
MCKSSIKAWHAYFKVLKQELAGGHWTLDNCLLNDAFLRELELLLRPRDIKFNHKENHSIDAFTDITLVDDTGGFVASTSGPPSDPDNQSYEEAIARDPIALCRSTVQAVRASGQQRDHLAAMTIQVKQAQLIRIMKVRWDSLYFMINRFHKLRLAVEYFLSLPVNRELAKLRLTDMEWTILQDFEIVLGMQKYHDCLHGQVQQPTPGTAALQQQRRSWHDLAGQYGLEDMMDVSSASSQQVQGVEEQFESYKNGPLSPRGTDIVAFWAIGDKTHPILYAMALDYLPIQASSVPSKRVFSSSAETDTKRRNRIHPVLMEVLQMLKFLLKQQWLNFTEG